MNSKDYNAVKRRLEIKYANYNVVNWQYKKYIERMGIKNCNSISFKEFEKLFSQIEFK